MVAYSLRMYSFIGHIPASSKASDTNDHSHPYYLLAELTYLLSSGPPDGATPPSP